MAPPTSVASLPVFRSRLPPVLPATANRLALPEPATVIAWPLPTTVGIPVVAVKSIDADPSNTSGVPVLLIVAAPAPAAMVSAPLLPTTALPALIQI